MARQKVDPPRIELGTLAFLSPHKYTALPIELRVLANFHKWLHQIPLAPVSAVRRCFLGGEFAFSTAAVLRYRH